MKIFNVFLIINALLWFHSGVLAEKISIKEKEGFMFEIVDNIPIKELLALKPDEHAENYPIGFIDIREFGYEWFPNDGKMKAAFLISAGLGDLGESPVAVKIWVPIEEKVIYDKKESKKQQELSKESVAIFCINHAVEKSKRCIVFSINESARVYIDGYLLGKLDY